MDSRPAELVRPFALPLAIAHTLTCLGYAWRINRFSCKTFSLLWEDHGFSEAFAGRIENALIIMLLIAAVCIWVRSLRWFALVGIVAMMAEMFSATFAAGAKYPLLYWAEWMMRLTTPLVAVYLLRLNDRSFKWSIWIMRMAIALTFGAHGIKALLADPYFTDLLLVYSHRIGLDLVTQDGAVLMLHIIGTVDLLLAAHLVFFKPERNRMVLVWMAVWGLVTALSRLTYGGMGNWHEVVIRTSHFLMPATLLWLVFPGWMKNSTALD